MFADGLELGVEDAYRLQAAVYGLRLDRGEQLAGYKVGCTSPTIRVQLGIDHSIAGRLYESECHANQSVLSLNRFDHLSIEGELAIELLRAPIAEDFKSGGIPNCVSKVFPVIELHHHVTRGAQSSAGELIANNAIHAGFIRGEGMQVKQFETLATDWTLDMFVAGVLTEQCRGRQLLKTIRSSLQWLQEHLDQMGELLLPGQIILTGSIPPLIRVNRESQVKVTTTPFGDVEAKFNL